MKNFVRVAVAVFVLVSCVSMAFAASKQDEAKSLVKKAVAALKEKGAEKAIAEYNTPGGKFIKGEFYIIAFDPKGIMLANGANQKLVGKNLFDMKDSEGTYLTRDIIKVAKAGGGWTEYKWTNPVSKLIETKKTYAEAVGDVTVGCGFYK